MFKILALITSFIAMALVATSYFVKKKELYLGFQFLGIIFLILSQFFSFEYFAAVGLVIALIRTFTFYLYEKKGKLAPIIWPIIFTILSLASYFIINLLILKTLKPLDILCLIALIFYAFIFRIRDLKIVRFSMLAPTSLSIFYYVLINAPIFTILSYSFELLANIVSIFKYHVLKPKKREEIN